MLQRHVMRSEGSSVGLPVDAAYSRSYGSIEVEDEKEIDLLAILGHAIRWRWLIGIFLLVGLLLGLIYSIVAPKMYLATARLELTMPTAKVLQDIELTATTSDERAIMTAIERIKSRSIAQRIVADLDLAQNNRFLALNGGLSLSNILERAFGVGGLDTGSLTADERDRLAVAKVQSIVTPTEQRNTSIIDVDAKFPDPALAAAIANATARAYIDQGVDIGSETSDLARNFITEQVREVKGKLETSEKALLDYAKAQNITVTGDDDSLVAKNIGALNESLSEVIQERLTLGRKVEQLDADRGAFLPEMVESDALNELRNKISTLKGEYREKLATFKPAFPVMQNLAGQISEMERQLQFAVDGLGESIRAQYDAAQAREADLKAKLSELENEQRTFQDKKIQYTILKREVDSNRSQYESLIGKLNEVGVGSNLQSRKAEIIEAAAVPIAPYAPRRSWSMLFGIILAGTLAAATIFLIELLNNKFMTPDQVEKELNLPMLGLIPLIKTGDPKLADFNSPTSAISEAFRSLRTALSFSGANGTPRTLAVTSTEPSEGKSTIAHKLAQDFAALGVRTLLIDTDMRRPNQHRMFGTDNVIGLSNLLTGTLDQRGATKVFRQTENPNLRLMTAGTIPPNPVDLLVSSRMTKLITALDERFDLIIFDCPPVMGLSDAPVISRLAEGTILVVSQKQVLRKSAAHAAERIRRAGGQLVGAVFNKFDAGLTDGYSGYRYMSYEYYQYAGSAETPSLSKPEAVSHSDAQETAQSRREVNDSIYDRFRRAGVAIRDRLERAE
ncbi:polysaccharide biosynthesis tyrosine autokinase [Notoacmeibacter sp. MSK16QG-6]|uniref:GumC family protein n=1 Tax=Notoacmeibacter sp. MSK16QG-6 TaxID=2957982 RepID=UPI0020A06335|nr:polysaccharide biosynthesis tyrosine autokinase [Notoacmeibacter sp. MSK16QG-6]MCP1198397.1 polysaccharide biosynthesis tyrosine autokinase [Notoacmeibacter sp. MSK16QG-6]